MTLRSILVWFVCASLIAKAPVVLGQASLVREAPFDALFSEERYEEAGELSHAQALRGEIASEAYAKRLCKLASVYLDKADEASAIRDIQRVFSLSDVSEEIQSEARLLSASVHLAYGDRISWQRAIDICRGVLGSALISDKTRIRAKEIMVPALFNLSRYLEAKGLLEELCFDESGVSPYAKARHSISLAKSYLVEQDFERARSMLAAMRGESAVDDVSVLLKDEDRAEVQLLWGMSYFEQGDNKNALNELSKVPKMPGQAADSPQTRQARVRLMVRKLIPEDIPAIKVLFIGSSHTLRGDVPLMVEKIAASAPEGLPRIVAAEHIRTGTGMKTFWDEGTAPYTARGKIVAEQWDAVVIETFFRYPPDLMEKYTAYYAELVQGRGGKLVLYESPVSKATRFPEGFSTYHQASIRLARKFGAPMAPSVSAWMNFLGERPSSEALNELYADHIHATIKGAYMTACCLYSALTGCSPLERDYPKEISEVEARRLQAASWEAFVSTAGETAK